MSYFNKTTKQLGSWNQKLGDMEYLPVRYTDTDINPGETPFFPDAAFFPVFHKIIMQAFHDFMKEAKSPLFIVENEVNELGHLAWVFGREDWRESLAYRVQIDDTGAAIAYNRGAGTLYDQVRTMLRTLDEKKGE